MKYRASIIVAVLAICNSSAGYGQSAAARKLEFEVVSIKSAANAQTGHFRRSASSSGGPGTADPGMYRCVNCNLAFLIAKAFELQRYQLPGESTLPDAVFDIFARVPEGATAEEFQAMLQTLLKDRFRLAYHFDKRQVQGYELVVAKGGPKLTPVREEKAPQSGGGHDHAGSGAMVFHGQGRYQGAGKTMSEVALMISNQLSKPVDDHTGLPGRYDIALSWSEDGASDGGHAAGSGEGWNHGAPSAAAAGAGTGTGAFSGPTLFGAVQAQLGLKLEPTKAAANVLIVERVDKVPTEN